MKRDPEKDRERRRRTAKRYAEKLKAKALSGRGGATSRKQCIQRKPKSPEKYAAQYGSEAYVKFLKRRPCDRCGVRGYSSSAHTKGAGMGLKAGPETLVSLCEDRPGTVGCHTLLDGYKIEDERPGLQTLALEIFTGYHRETA